MVFNRYLTAGRLSELVGDVAIETDVLLRMLGFSRHSEKYVNGLSEDVAALVDSYLAGVNAYLDGPDYVAPIEFTLLGNSLLSTQGLRSKKIDQGRSSGLEVRQWEVLSDCGSVHKYVLFG